MAKEASDDDFSDVRSMRTTAAHTHHSEEGETKGINFLTASKDVKMKKTKWDCVKRERLERV